MYSSYKEHLSSQLGEIMEAGLFKNERVIVSPQGAEIQLTRTEGSEFLRQQLPGPVKQQEAD
jgi:glycine C-acetyltransferase